MNRRQWLGFISLIALISTACGRGGSRARSPHWGKDTCKVCRMAVTEKRPAAQLVGPGVQLNYYDDLGCAVQAILTKRAPAGATLYVLAPGRQEQQEQWVPASQIRFEDGAQTPMNYGYLPKEGAALSIDEVIDRIRQKHGRAWRLSESK